MKRLLVVVLAMGILLWGAAAEAQTGLRRNVLENGGFENGLEGWQPSQGHQLTEDKAQAHSGSRCLFGEVTEENRAHILLRDVPMSANKLYEFEIWARATNATKLVLWRRTAGQRLMVTNWQNVPKKWRNYRIIFSVEADGPTTLEIVAPSSHGAPVGKMWIDDIALFEHDLPASSDISSGEGFNDAPVMACTPEGSVWAAWLSFRDGADTLQAARLSVQGEKASVARAWQLDGGPGVYIMYPAVAAHKDQAWVAYSAEKRGNWDIYLARLTEQGPQAPVRIGGHPAVDVKPSIAANDDGVTVAWESNRDGGQRQVYLARVGATPPVAVPRRISSLGPNNYCPSVCVPAPGRTVVVWHSFRQNNFDLYMHDTDATGPRERRLTSMPTIDREPRVIAGPDGVWVAWDNANSATYHVGAANKKRVQIARLRPWGLEAPKGLQQTVLGRQAEAPDITFDSKGRLWVSARVPRGRNAGWDTIALCCNANGWSEPMRVSARKGLCRRPWLAGVGEGILICYQGDTIPNSWATVEASAEADSGVYVGLLAPTDALRPGSLALEPYTEPQDKFEAANLRIARGEDTPRRSIEYGGQTLNLYFGNLHEHTDISVCNRTGDQTQDQSYQSMRDVTCHDFAALTDHGYNINAYLWSYTGKCARANNDPERFLTFLGEEWTSTFEEYTEEHPYGFYGHRNLILEDPYSPEWFNARDAKTPAQVWEILRRKKVSFIHIPHQLADTGNVPTDWNYVDEEAQPVAEIFQTRGSYEYEGTPRQAKRATPEGWFLQDAWAKGVVIGVIASPDHGGGYGKAAVYAPELSRKAVLEAIRARHTYGTTAAKIFLDVRVNGHLMGEKAPAPDGKPVRVTLKASCPGEIQQVQVCRNNEFIYAPVVRGAQCDIAFVDNAPPQGPCYYYVRVIQQDGEIAWSSPVWLGQAGPV